MPERTLTVKIIGDDRSLQQAFNRSEKKTQTFNEKSRGFGRDIARGAIVAAAGIVSVQKAFEFAGNSVDEASAINEEVAKSQQIFGESSGEVIAWSDTMARAFGVSKREALEATGVFGNLFRVVGLGPAAAAEMSRALTELAADVGSFNNASPVDVLEAIRSGLIGEAEPLRRYGVLLSETRVQQVAMAETGKTNAKELTNQEKALARYNIILADTAPAQGDVNRTAGSLANQQRELAAQFANLEGTIGKVLIPTLLSAVEAANLLFAALDKMRGVDFSPGFDFPDPPGWLVGVAGLAVVSPLGAGVAATAHLLKDDEKELKGLDAVMSGVNTTLGGLVKAMTKRADALRKANKFQESVEAKRFAEHVAGLGLKIDRAALTAGTDDDLAALRELERSLERRIAAEGKTFKLVTQLVDVRGRIAAVLEGQAADATRKANDSYNEAVDALELRLDIARTTRGFADDLRALKAIERQILNRIEVEGRTVDLLRRLFENRQAQAQTLNDARNAAQFEALGLTPEGDRPVAGRGSLLKRARSLQDQIKGTVLDTPKTRRELARIVAVLKDTTKAAGREVRAAILSMLNDISSALDGGGDSGGPLTKFAKRGVGKLIEGLGLSPEQVKEIRQRFSQYGRLDLTGGGARPAGPTVVVPQTRGADQGPPERDLTVNVYIDGQKVEATVTRRQQKKRGRNAPQRRGVNPGARR